MFFKYSFVFIVNYIIWLFGEIIRIGIRFGSRLILRVLLLLFVIVVMLLLLL